jgi:hypothetical protein
MSLHTEYFDKIKHFSLDRRMENLPTSETLIASLMRQLGLSSNNREGEVWPSSDLFHQLFKTDDVERISKVFRSELSSPISKKAQKELDGRFKCREYVKPIIPSIASMTHSPRGGTGTGSPWNPGRWLLEEFALAFDDYENYLLFVRELSESLLVSKDDKHDLANYFTNALKSAQGSFDEKVVIESFDKYKRKSQFGWKASSIHLEYVNLIRFVISIKQNSSRYRWVLFLDAALRMFATSASIWRFRSVTLFIESIENGDDFNMFSRTHGFIKYGATRTQIVKDGLKEYILSYLTLFFLCEQFGLDAVRNTTPDLYDFLNSNSSIEEVDKARKKAVSTIKGFSSEFSLRTSTLKNSKEFLEYVGVRKEDYSFSTEDHTFHYKKMGRPYRYQFGDTLLILLVNYVGDRMGKSQFTSSDFVHVLSRLGIQINFSEFSQGSLSKDLLKLGLVEELSDSDSGMIFRVL